MPDAVVIGQFERRLVELGCPGAQARRKARELADHHADLKQAALEEGLSDAAAEARAVAQLGEPSGLAERLAFTMRQSSWWGRHPVIGFCLLPLFSFFPFWVLCGSILAGLFWLTGHIFGTAYQVTIDTAHALALDPDEFVKYSGPLNAALNGIACAVMSVLFCWLARRSVSGLKWIVAACAVCSFSGAFSEGNILRDSITLHWVSNPDWICALIPGLVACAAFLRQRQTVRRLPVPSGPRGSPASFAPGQTWAVRFLTTPTYWISTPALAGILVLGRIVGLNITRGRDEIFEGAARAETLRTSTWPAESAATLERVYSRQGGDVKLDETTIDLRPYVNVTLPAASEGLPMNGEKMPVELPRGTRNFGGVTFEVAGKIQLMGRGLLGARRIYPAMRKNIPIAQKCSQIHLLHGAAHVSGFNVTIARLVLHYADGSTREIGIVSGEHLLDCWGPIYATPVMGERLVPSSGDTELAWVGSEAGDAQKTSFLAARIYRTTFHNPQPGVEISSMDYISTLTDAAPFLVGLTVE